MSDHIDLPAAGFLHNLLDSPGQFLAAVGYRKGGLMISVVNHGSVSDKFIRDPAPVIGKSVIAEKDAVYKQYRVFRAADAGSEMILPHQNLRKALW